MEAREAPSAYDVMKKACGFMNSGKPDLASNPSACNPDAKMAH
jgi:hypothetical protein